MEKLERVQKILNKRLDSKDVWKKVILARMIERPTSLDYIENIFDSFIELHGDRYFGDDPSVVCGIGLLDGEPVTIVAQQKGRNTEENIKRNFGMPEPDGYRKSIRIMKQAHKFDRPIICFVDTPGAFCGMEAEERGQGEAIARNLMEIFKLEVPIISLIIGEGGSGGALAFAVADSVWMLENSIYSILSPEGFAGILWKDASKAREAAAVMKITAEDLKKYGIIDKVLKEPAGGAQKDVGKMSRVIKEQLIEKIGILRKRSKKELLENRYNKFRHIGKFLD
ncbi:acetyl-CoA carboxylase carboxyltransferase subunit alpha [Clostridium sp. Mt-5]|uniref:Acetyl-coenzyme A carboxylase carboxyl transferase subunit alpha n=1 Tax=Clostridium moutaii TaxID=3240932 RepID=A0ABV4BTE5_9CLOT